MPSSRPTHEIASHGPAPLASCFPRRSRLCRIWQRKTETASAVIRAAQERRTRGKKTADAHITDLIRLIYLCERAGAPSKGQSTVSLASSQRDDYNRNYTTAELISIRRNGG